MRATTIVRVLAYTAVGVLLTVVTSFGFSLTQRYDSPAVIFVRVPPGTVIRADATPVVLYWQRTGSAVWNRTTQRNLDLSGWGGQRRDPSELEDQWNRPELSWTGLGSEATREFDLIHASGIPLFAFSYRGKTWTANPSAIAGGWQLGAWDVAAARQRTMGQAFTGVLQGSAGGVLPLTPIWTGLIVDTAFFSITSALIVRSVVGGKRFVVSAIRRRGGRCTKCGYSRKNLPSATCPECGHKENEMRSDHAVATS